MSTSWQGNSYGQQYDRDGMPVNNSGAGSSNYYAAFAQPGQQPVQQPQQPAAVPAQYAQPQPYNQYPPMMNPPKSKAVAALLFFFLGGFGAGNFYMGQNNLGVTKLVLMFFGFITSFFIIGLFVMTAVGLWALVEMIMVLSGSGGYDRDANGVPLQ